MDKRFVGVILLSAVFATFVAGFFYRLMAHTQPVAAAQMVPVVVAASQLPVGARTAAANIKIVNMPVAARPRDSFARIEDAVDRPVLAAVLQDEPLVRQRLGERGAVAGLAPMIPAGYRAVSVRVNDVIGVAGYVQPGMRVDVLVTGHPPGSQDSATHTVLQNIPVLSAGQVLQPEPKGQAISATLVTLQTTPEQAELLTLASDEGHIQLVLRNPVDSSAGDGHGARLSGIFGPGDKPAPEPRAVQRPVRVPEPPVPAAPEKPATVEIIRGAHRSEELAAK